MKPENPQELEVQIRINKPPYDLMPTVGYLPFEKFGDKFCVTRVPYGIDLEEWQVTHIETGAAVPFTWAMSKLNAQAKAIRTLDAVGIEKFQQAKAKIQSHLTARQTKDAHE